MKSSEIRHSSARLHAAEEKNSLRRELITLRDAVTDVAGASAAVCARLDDLPELAGRRVICGYAATAKEVAIDASLRRLIADGVTVCLPWVQGVELGMSAVEDLDADLAPGWRGVREPALGRRQPLRPAAVEAAIVPGVGFDTDGNRLGYGGGHFDRFLSRLPRGAVIVGVAFDEQVTDAIPVEPHDRPVDVLVTPTKTLRPARSSSRRR